MDDIEADDFPQDELTNRELFKSPVNHELWTDDKGEFTLISYVNLLFML